MNDQPLCPYCYAPVSEWVTYIFVPAENRRFHERCFKAAHPKAYEDRKEEVIQ